MAVVNKIYRRLITFKRRLFSICRIIHFRLKYPALDIDFNSTVSKNCDFVCVDKSKMVIRKTFFGPGSFIVTGAGGTLIINDSYIGPNCVIVAKEHVEIGKYCSIAEMVVIRDQDHIYGEKLIRDSGEVTGRITIGENVWIGAKATVLKNVAIGNNSVIGANSVVNKNFPSGSVIAGVPAKEIRKT
jgi:acetyltransferase-like isoleucine patch superfamily enzyme